jgi:Ser/Thr protein kinase RdoA (MazF antagonist)
MKKGKSAYNPGNTDYVKEICMDLFHESPIDIQRRFTGISGYVYALSFRSGKYILKISPEKELISGSAYWLERLAPLALPIPKIVALNRERSPFHCAMTFIEGEDLGSVYKTLSDEQKKTIARQLFAHHETLEKIPRARGFGFLHSYDDSANMKPSWEAVVASHIERSVRRIIENRIFPSTYVSRVSYHLPRFRSYFSGIAPKAFFDDATTKNLLVHRGELSGIVDLDWICFGDRLYALALTAMSLLRMKADLTYVEQWEKLERLSEGQERALLFYTLVFCVDFMSEKGMRFNKERIEKAEAEEIDSLKNIFEDLEDKLREAMSTR